MLADNLHTGSLQRLLQVDHGLRFHHVAKGKDGLQAGVGFGYAALIEYQTPLARMADGGSVDAPGHARVGAGCEHGI